MGIVIAATLILWMFASGWLPARLLLPVRLQTPLTVGVVAAALGPGLVTLPALWTILAWPGGPAFEVAVLSTFIVTVGIWMRRAPARQQVAWSRGQIAGTSQPLARLGLAITGAVACGIVFNAVSWPFPEGDALALYGPYGKFLYESRSLPVGDRLHEAYPMLVPMAYAFAHWATGGVNEYVARLVPAVMSASAIAAAAALGQSVGSRRTGLVAAVLVATTPTFGRWASTGYTDVPASLFVTLMALGLHHWWAARDRRALALAGIGAGLAMWTRNSALAFLPALAFVVASRHAVEASRGRTDAGTLLRDWLAVLLPIVVIAAPWYARNLLVFGFAVPPTIWTDQARHGVTSFAIMLRSDQAFGLSGWLYTAGIAYGIVSAASGRRRAGSWYVLLTLILPFLAAWWWLASYESRFLMIIVPLLAVMAALLVDDVVDAVMPRLSPRHRHWAMTSTALVLVGMAAASLRKTVEHKAALVRDPLMNDAERHRVQLQGLYDLVSALNELPPGSRIAGVPSIARYHLHLPRFTVIDFAPLEMTPATLSERFDVAVYRVTGDGPAPWLDDAGEPLLRTADGYRMYRTGSGDQSDRGSRPR